MARRHPGRDWRLRRARYRVLTREMRALSVYFVYRCHYEGPSCKHVRRFEDDSVLAWFQRVWEPAKDAPDAGEWLKAELGCDVYGFGSLFEAAQEEELKAPKSDRALKGYLDEHLYVEGEILFKPHAIQILTDDDELEMAYYIFDDHYVHEYPGRADYLLHDDWRLPTSSADAPFKSPVRTKRIGKASKGAGATYVVLITFYDSGNLTDIDTEGPREIDGVRIPELADYLRQASPDDEWPAELAELRAELLSSGATQNAIAQALKQISGRADKIFDFVTEGFDPSRSDINASDHLIQLSFHVGRWFEKDVYQQWIFFDDQWAAANKDLADGLLRYATRWDVLTGK